MEKISANGVRKLKLNSKRKTSCWFFLPLGRYFVLFSAETHLIFFIHSFIHLLEKTRINILGHLASQVNVAWECLEICTENKTKKAE